MNRPDKTNPATPGTGRLSAEDSSPASGRLTGAELKCMKALWFDGAKTVRDVHRVLHPNHPLAYTTILTVMDRLTRKGFLARTRRGKAHYYLPRCSFEESRSRAVAELVRTWFAGSARQLEAFLTDGPPPTGPGPSRPNDKAEPGPQLNEHLL
jgi:predicted transcriptional regulator